MPTFIKTGFWEKTKKGYREWLNLDQFVESKIPSPTYKVFTALLTQSGGGNPQNLTEGGSLIIGVTYVIDDDGGNGWDFTNVGAPNNDLFTSFIATGTTPNSWGTSGMLAYNIGAPVATVLENTIGNIWFTYEGEGEYYINSEGLFDINKIYNSVTNNIDMYNFGSFKSITINPLSISRLFLATGDVDAYYNDIMSNVPIEIRVYN
jgi:hypothetical protein